MSGAEDATREAERRDEAGLAEVDSLGVASVVLYGRDGQEPADRAPDEPRAFAARSAWLWRWTGWRRH